MLPAFLVNGRKKSIPTFQPRLEPAHWPADGKPARSPPQTDDLSLCRSPSIAQAESSDPACTLGLAQHRR